MGGLRSDNLLDTRDQEARWMPRLLQRSRQMGVHSSWVRGIIVIKGVYKVVIVFYICIVICNSLILLRTILEHATGLL